MAPNLSKEMTDYKFEEWLRGAKPGQRLEYHRGHLAFDREEVHLIYNKPHTVIIEPANSVGRAAYRAYESGLVELTQERFAPMQCRYWARRTEKMKRNRL